jgi:predicted RNA-binding protein with PUA-like domain
MGFPAGSGFYAAASAAKRPALFSLPFFGALPEDFAGRAKVQGCTRSWEVHAMALWLFKEEPDHYNFSDLEREGETTWSGVSNALARKNLRQVKEGDRILYYHTGKEKAVVGEMKAVSGPLPDPEDAKGVAIKVQPVKRWGQPVTLEQIKKDKGLATWDLVRLPRLSVMPVTEVQWRRVEALSRASGK